MNRGTDQLGEFRFVEFFPPQQGLCHDFKLLAMHGQQRKRAFRGCLEDLSHFAIDLLHRVFAELTLLMNFTTQKRVLVRKLIAHRTQLHVHSPVGNHAPRQACCTFQVVFCTNGRLFVDDLFGGPPRHQQDELVL